LVSGFLKGTQTWWSTYFYQPFSSGIRTLLPFEGTLFGFHYQGILFRNHFGFNPKFLVFFSNRFKVYFFPLKKIWANSLGFLWGFLGLLLKLVFLSVNYFPKIFFLFKTWWFKGKDLVRLTILKVFG